MYIDPGTANHLHHGYHEVGKNSLKTAQESAKIAAKLIGLLIQRLKAKKAVQEKDSYLVEIKVDNETVYKGVTGQKPEVNKLTSKQLQMLESAIGYESAKELQVSVDEEPVYQQKNGILEIDRINSRHKVAKDSPPYVTKEIENLSTVISAKRILDALGKDVYESDDFRLERNGDTLIVFSKDGRGEIARSEVGRIAGQVSDSDVSKLGELEKSIQEIKSQSLVVNRGKESKELEID